MVHTLVCMVRMLLHTAGRLFSMQKLHNPHSILSMDENLVITDYTPKDTANCQSTDSTAAEMSVTLCSGLVTNHFVVAGVCWK